MSFRSVVVVDMPDGHRQALARSGLAVVPRVLGRPNVRPAWLTRPSRGSPRKC